MWSIASTTYLLLVLGTIGLAGWIVARALYRNDRLAEMPFVVSVMWLYFYGYMAIVAATSLTEYMPPWTLDFGQAVALGALVAFVIGWSRGLGWRGRAGAAPLVPFPGYSARKLWTLGLVLLVIGGISHYVLVSQEVIDWEKTSAYWYLLYHVSYPGVGLCLLAAAKDPALRAPPYKVTLGLAIAAIMFPHLLNARRGPVFPMAIMLLFVPTIAGRWRPRRIVMLGGLAAVGTLMLLLLAVRPWVYGRGGPFSSTASMTAGWGEALGEVSVDNVFVSRTMQIEDNEYVYHCAMVSTNYERGCYQYGTGYLTLFTHFVPRSVWPDKPMLGQGWFPDVLEQIPVVMGWPMTTGAASGGVAEVFNQFGFASAFFWLLLGWGMGRLYVQATRREDPRWAMAYVGVLCSTHWLVSQGVAAAFVPMAIYIATPWLAIRWARSRRIAPRPHPARPAFPNG